MPGIPRWNFGSAENFINELNSSGGSNESVNYCWAPFQQRNDFRHDTFNIRSPAGVYRIFNLISLRIPLATIISVFTLRSEGSGAGVDGGTEISSDNISVVLIELYR